MIFTGEGKWKLNGLLKMEKIKRNLKFLISLESSGTALAMYNLDDSIKNFARACMNYGLGRKWPVYLSTKNTILKVYDNVLRICFKKYLKKNLKINLIQPKLLMNID